MQIIEGLNEVERIFDIIGVLRTTNNVCQTNNEAKDEAHYILVISIEFGEYYHSEWRKNGHDHLRRKHESCLQQWLLLGRV